MKKVYVLSALFITALLTVVPGLSFAQGPGDPGCNPDLYCPIDGGLTLLIAGAGAIAARKALKKKQDKAVEG